MSTHPKPRFAKADAERLLAGGTEPQALASVLRAAAAPAQGPATGAQSDAEWRALAAFRVARLAPAPTSRRASMIKSLVTKLLAAKLATTAAVAAAATGGLTLAAATGNLPAPIEHAAHAVFGASNGSQGAQDLSASGAPSTDSPSDAAGAGEPTDSQTDEPSVTDSASDSSSETPSPSLPGLCHAFQAHSTDNPGKWLDSSAFTVLVTAAGGKDNVTAFCTTLIGPAATHAHGSDSPGDAQSSDQPDRSGDHSGRPSETPGSGKSSHSHGSDGSAGTDSSNSGDGSQSGQSGDGSSSDGGNTGDAPSSSAPTPQH